MRDPENSMERKSSIVAVEPGPSNAISFRDHPVLESGNLSYPHGRYTLDFHFGESRSSITLIHRVEGASMINRLLDCGAAQYACAISSPVSSYRAVLVSPSARQEVLWDDNELGEPPLFTPMVLCTQDKVKIRLEAGDGVHSIWQGQTIVLNKGSRLALGTVIQLQSSILHLLMLRENERLSEGQFMVETESEPFRFVVDLHPNLHSFLRHPEAEGRSNIMTHIVTACLARLQSEYGKLEEENGLELDNESGIQSHRNLQTFADFLQVRGLGHWTDSDFRPERIATALYPLRVPKPPGFNDSEDVGE